MNRGGGLYEVIPAAAAFPLAAEVAILGLCHVLVPSPEDDPAVGETIPLSVPVYLRD